MIEDSLKPKGKTHTQIDFLGKKGKITLTNIDPSISQQQIFELKQTLIQFKCNPSIQKMVFEGFIQKQLQHNCPKAQLDLIRIKVIEKVNKKQFEQRLLQQKLIVQIECESEVHFFYLLVLIKKEWEDKLVKRESLSLQQVIETTSFYCEQYQLDLQDLIEIFEAPLTMQYARL